MEGHNYTVSRLTALRSLSLSRMAFL